jgi:hypothetical protein
VVLLTKWAEKRRERDEVLKVHDRGAWEVNLEVMTTRNANCHQTCQSIGGNRVKVVVSHFYRHTMPVGSLQKITFR